MRPVVYLFVKFTMTDERIPLLACIRCICNDKEKVVIAWCDVRASSVTYMLLWNLYCFQNMNIYVFEAGKHHHRALFVYGRPFSAFTVVQVWT
jgi:hypothetical protein